jgi:glutamate decarboxylase
VIQRILVRHGFTRAMADELLLEMQSALDHLAQYPPEASSTLVLAGAKARQYNHSGRVIEPADRRVRA